MLHVPDPALLTHPAPCTCLVVQLEEGTKAGAAVLSDKCLPLVDVAEPPNMKQAFEAGLTVALLQSQLSAVESTTGLTMLKRDTQGNAQVRRVGMSRAGGVDGQGGKDREERGGGEALRWRPVQRSAMGGGFGTHG